jgi:hypothetical protein
MDEMTLPNQGKTSVNRRLELTHFEAFKIDPPWGKKKGLRLLGDDLLG